MKRLGSAKVLMAVFAALAALVAAAGYFLLVSPQRSKANAAAAQVATAQAQLTTARAEAASGRDRQTVQVADIFRLAKAMPASVDMPDQLLELNGLAAASGVEFTSITPGAPSSAPLAGYESQPLSLIFQGNYRTLSNFLARMRELVRVNQGVLYSSGRLFTVDSITFSPGQMKFPQLQATLNVETFIYAGAPTTGAVTFSGGTTPTTQTSSSTQSAAGSTTGAAN